MPQIQPQQSTTALLTRIRDGQDAAREELYRRCLPMLRHFARGRLPAHRRDLSDTEDLVQVTLMRTLDKLDEFDSRNRGAFFAYLRTIMLNAIRDEIRRWSRKPPGVEETELPLAADDSVVATAIGVDTLSAYESGLASLSDSLREAVILRVEFDLSYEEIAIELELPSSDAARMRAARGLAIIARSMP